MAGKSARYAWVFIVVAAIGLALGGNLLWSLLFGPSLSGSIQAAGPEIGTWVLTPDICQSGDRRRYYGVQVFSSKDKQLAFVYDEDPITGGRLSVNVPGARHSYVLGDRDCRVLKASLQRGTIINRIQAMDGSIDVDCRVDDNTLTGHLSFENCD